MEVSNQKCASAGFVAIAGGLKSLSNTDQFVHHLDIQRSTFGQKSERAVLGGLEKGERLI